MSTPLTLSAEFRKIVEARMNQVLKGVEVTFNQIIETQKITPAELKEEIDSLQETFNLLFQKWSLEILYTLLLKDVSGFGEIKKNFEGEFADAFGQAKNAVSARLHNPKCFGWSAAASGLCVDG